MQTLTPYVQTFTMIMQFVILAMLGLNYRTMWRTFKMTDRSAELIRLYRSEIAYLTMRVEVLEARAGAPIEEQFRGRAN